MIKGARRARPEADADTGEILELSQENAIDWIGSPEAAYSEEPGLEPEKRADGRIALAILLILAALGWAGLSIWALTQRSIPLLTDFVSVAALVSAPLILLGMIWQLFGRSPRRETERFRTAVAQMQRETEALESILGIVAGRLEENYVRLTGETAKLMTLGDEASDRLGRVTHYISKETATLDRKAGQLETAATAARVDIGVLLSDLPRAEEQARNVAEAMKQAGLAALGEAGQLESQLSALVARGREADEVAGGTAQRLAAHLARIESSTAAAKTQLDDATNSMTNAVDEAMARTAEAVDAARISLDTQSRATLAMIENSKAALEQAGEESGLKLARRLEEIGGQIEMLATHLAQQDAASETLTARLSRDLAELDERFVALGRTGNSNNEQLAASVDAVRMRVRELHEEVNGGQERATELIGRAHEMAQALSGITAHLHGELPSALLTVEEEAVRTRRTVEEMAALVEAVQVSACDAANQTAAAEASIARQQGALDHIVSKLRENVSETEAQLRALSEAAEGADAASLKIAMETGPQLIEALIQVREAAKIAAERARETIAAVIPEAAVQLGEASHRAMETALTGTVDLQVNELARLSERAVETARAASERLTRQMLAIGEAAAIVEARIDTAREERRTFDQESFSRRVSLLIEALNSTAIDVGKILSNDVPDGEWAAYLKGDRGVFTRRAVRLLDNAEAREIGQYYQTDAEFREQVNRYVHDFEGMLRRVLDDRNSEALGVTILSSDMGKLYVALAQAIERLRG